MESYGVHRLHSCGGFTRPRRCGQARTYAGLIEKIPYRQDLGVSAVSCSPSLPSTSRALHRVGIEVILDAVYTTSGRVERRPSHDLLSRIGDKAIELAANHLFDELPDAVADPGLDRIEPIVEKLGGRLGQELRGFNLRVVSGPALQRQVIRG